MGLFSSKENPEAELKKFFKREIRGHDMCSFSGSLKKYDSSILKNFENWLIQEKYTFTCDQNFPEETFKYTITKTK